MSASRKKQLRREEYAASMTEKQRKEMKEAKKLRIYTIVFAVVIVLMVGVVIATAITSSGMIEKSTTAMTVDGSKINDVELNYYYIDAVNDFLSQYGSYASFLGLDTTKPLNEQYYEEEAGTTWSDYFLDSATSNIHTIYSLYHEAVANNYSLNQESLDSIDSNISNATTYAMIYGFSDADAYLSAMYGKGSSADSYRDYLNVLYTARGYYNEVLDSLEYTDEDLRAAEADNPKVYNSYSYNYYYLAASKFYEGGTTDEEGNTTYSDEEKAAGLAAAEAAAKELAKCESLEALDEAIAALSINAEAENAATTAVTDTMYSKLSSTMSDWVTDDARSEGDTTCIPNVVTSEDEDGNEVETTNGYYVVYFVGSNDNTFSLVNVRHILVGFEGGTTDENGTTTYSDEEKAAAKAEAEALLESFADSEGTEEMFAELANENSDDTGSNTNGGLYEESRKPGDTGIVESDYGYHVMYFSGFSDTTYRDYMITSDLRNTDIDQWQSDLVAASDATVKNTTLIAKDLVVSKS